MKKKSERSSHIDQPPHMCFKHNTSLFLTEYAIPSHIHEAASTRLGVQSSLSDPGENVRESKQVRS